MRNEKHEIRSDVIGMTGGLEIRNMFRYVCLCSI